MFTTLPVCEIPATPIGLRLACKLADLPQKTASQTAQNSGPSAIRLLKVVVNNQMAGRVP